MTAFLLSYKNFPFRVTATIASFLDSVEALFSLALSEK
jgi:hypothetical protein